MDAPTVILEGGTQRQEEEEQIQGVIITGIKEGRPLDATFTTRPSALPYLWHPMLSFLIYIKHFPI